MKSFFQRASSKKQPAVNGLLPPKPVDVPSEGMPMGAAPHALGAPPIVPSSASVLERVGQSKSGGHTKPPVLYPTAKYRSVSRQEYRPTIDSSRYAATHRRIATDDEKGGMLSWGVSVKGHTAERHRDKHATYPPAQQIFSNAFAESGNPDDDDADRRVRRERRKEHEAMERAAFGDDAPDTRRPQWESGTETARESDRDREARRIRKARELELRDHHEAARQERRWHERDEERRRREKEIEQQRAAKEEREERVLQERRERERQERKERERQERNERERQERKERERQERKERERHERKARERQEYRERETEEERKVCERQDRKDREREERHRRRAREREEYEREKTARRSQDHQAPRATGSYQVAAKPLPTLMGESGESSDSSHWVLPAHRRYRSADEYASKDPSDATTPQHIHGTASSGEGRDFTRIQSVPHPSISTVPSRAPTAVPLVRSTVSAGSAKTIRSREKELRSHLRVQPKGSGHQKSASMPVTNDLSASHTPATDVEYTKKDHTQSASGTSRNHHRETQPEPNHRAEDTVQRVPGDHAFYYAHGAEARVDIPTSVPRPVISTGQSSASGNRWSNVGQVGEPHMSSLAPPSSSLPIGIQAMEDHAFTGIHTTQGPPDYSTGPSEAAPSPAVVLASAQSQRSYPHTSAINASEEHHTKHDSYARDPPTHESAGTAAPPVSTSRVSPPNRVASQAHQDTPQTAQHNPVAWPTVQAAHQTLLAVPAQVTLAPDSPAPLPIPAPVRSLSMQSSNRASSTGLLSRKGTLGNASFLYDDIEVPVKPIGVRFKEPEVSPASVEAGPLPETQTASSTPLNMTVARATPAGSPSKAPATGSNPSPVANIVPAVGPDAPANAPAPGPSDSSGSRPSRSGDNSPKNNATKTDILPAPPTPHVDLQALLTDPVTRAPSRSAYSSPESRGHASAIVSPAQAAVDIRSRYYRPDLVTAASAGRTNATAPAAPVPPVETNDVPRREHAREYSMSRDGQDEKPRRVIRSRDTNERRKESSFKTRNPSAIASASMPLASIAQLVSPHPQLPALSSSGPVAATTRDQTASVGYSSRPPDFAPVASTAVVTPEQSRKRSDDATRAQVAPSSIPPAIYPADPPTVPFAQERWERKSLNDGTRPAGLSSASAYAARQTQQKKISSHARQNVPNSSAHTVTHPTRVEASSGQGSVPTHQKYSSNPQSRQKSRQDDSIAPPHNTIYKQSSTAPRAPDTTYHDSVYPGQAVQTNLRTSETSHHKQPSSSRHHEVQPPDSFIRSEKRGVDNIPHSYAVHPSQHLAEVAIAQGPVEPSVSRVKVPTAADQPVASLVQNGSRPSLDKDSPPRHETLKRVPSRTSIAPSLSSREKSKKAGLFSIFRHRTAQSLPHFTADKSTGPPEPSYASIRKVKPAKNAPTPIAVDIPIPPSGKGAGGPVKTSLGKLGFFSNKRNRTMSDASAQAVQGTAPNTIIGSPTTSYTSTPMQPIMTPDPVAAAQQWRKREEERLRLKPKRRPRPGVTFDVSEDVPENGKSPMWRKSQRLALQEAAAAAALSD